jgi:hypothetical protein
MRDRRSMSLHRASPAGCSISITSIVADVRLATSPRSSSGSSDA